MNNANTYISFDFENESDQSSTKLLYQISKVESNYRKFFAVIAAVFIILLAYKLFQKCPTLQ